MKPLVSILIPAYNAEETLPYTIQSALAQTWPRREIIVVNDGSTDNTEKIARQFEPNGVVVVSKANGGQSEAINYALPISRGDYIQHLDSDDLLAPDKIERQLDALRPGDGNRILFSSAWAPFYYRTRTAQFVHNGLCEDLAPSDWLVRKLSQNIYMANASWLVSRELTEAAGPWDATLQYDQDGEYFARVLLAAEKVCYVPGSRVYYRTNTTKSVSYIGGSNAKKESLLRSMKLHIQYLQSLEQSERVRKACLTYLQNWYLEFAPERADLVAEIERMAATLGGEMNGPHLRRKFAWMRPVFGIGTAKWAQMALPQVKSQFIRRYDKAMFGLEHLGGSMAQPPATAPAKRGSRLVTIASDHLAKAVAGEREQGTAAAAGGQAAMRVSLLTGGGDPHYAYGLSTAILAQGGQVDLIGSDEFEQPAFRGQPGLRLLNLRGSVDPNAGAVAKFRRILLYYMRLVRYAAIAKTRTFHILWNNKFEAFDRTVLMLYYRMLGKRVILTAHNVNAGRRDASDTRLNRLTLRIQYRLAHHIFVHTKKMAQELAQEFHVPYTRIAVIPFGTNNAVPDSSLTPRQARERLGLAPDKKVLLFFGRITAYKGLEYLMEAFRFLAANDGSWLLIIAGKVDDDGRYWSTIREEIRADVECGRVLLKAEFVPDKETEVYFKAADALVLPYRHIYQSGILCLAHRFGLPVLAADVGSFREEIVEARTGFIFAPENAADLERAVREYFASNLYRDLDSRRSDIRRYTAECHSWETVGRKTMSVYTGLPETTSMPELTFHQESTP